MAPTVIITDDDQVTLFMHNLFVKRSGLSKTPISFSNAKETLAYLEKHANQETVHLILLDINMPEMSGWDLLDCINKKKYKNIYVLVISSSVNVEDREKASSYAHVVGFCEKPLSDAKIQTFTESEQYKSAWKILD